MKYFISIFCIFLLTHCKLNTSKNESTNNQKKINYEELGARIATESQSAILVKLTSAMQEKGIDGAVEYCKENISNIIDSLSKVHQCQIRRTSLKLRNTANTPRNDDEVMILQQFHENYSQNRKLESKLIERDGRWIYYKPIIVMMETCLKCHGRPNDQIDFSTLNKIQKLYPNDQAINYQLNDFRGMWVIEFEHRKTEKGLLN